MSQISVVGGHGYVGTSIAGVAQEAGGLTRTISRSGGTKFGLPSTAWPDFLAELPDCEDARVIWLLDGANNDEPERVAELLAAAHRSGRFCTPCAHPPPQPTTPNPADEPKPTNSTRSD